MSSSPHRTTAARLALGAAVLFGVGTIAWNAASGLRVTDEYGRGPFVLQSQQTQQLTDCFNTVVFASVPKGARLHVDTTDAAIEQRLTEGPYPHAIVVAPEVQADYVVYVALGATEEFPPCPGYTVTVTPVEDGG